MLTILGLQITMHNHDTTFWCLLILGPGNDTQDIGSNLGRVNAIMTSVQSRDELRKGSPNERLGSPLALIREVLDHSAQVAASTVFHVQVELLLAFQVLTVVVGDNVGVSEARETLEFGVELFSFFLGHFAVVDFLSAEDEAIRLPPHPADNTKRAMACSVTAVRAPEV